jgi:uncharacterized protein (DUF58 family)
MLKPVASDDMDYANVREYRYGDPLKTIHWNLSARNPGVVMYTRLYEAYVNPSLIIVIDAYSPHLAPEELMSLFDGMVECAYALSKEAHEAGIDSEVHYIDKTHTPAIARLTSLSDTDSLVMGMLSITPEETAGPYAKAPEVMLRRAGMSSHGAGNIALVTSRTDATLLSSLTQIRLRKRNVMVFVAVPRSLEGRKREQFLSPLRRLSELQIAHYIIESTEVQTQVVGL